MTMSEKMKTQVTMPSDTEILVTRTFNAPRHLVWQVWTEARHLQEWWGPEEWTLPICDVDFRPGGTWFYCMQSPDGMKACGKAYYREIHEPERFVMEDTFVDADGNPLAGMPAAQVTVEFIEEDGKTTVINRSRYATKAERDKVIEMGVEAGIDQTFNRLDIYLQTLQ